MRLRPRWLCPSPLQDLVLIPRRQKGEDHFLCVEVELPALTSEGGAGWIPSLSREQTCLPCFFSGQSLLVAPSKPGPGAEPRASSGLHKPHLSPRGSEHPPSAACRPPPSPAAPPRGFSCVGSLCLSADARLLLRGLMRESWSVSTLTLRSAVCLLRMSSLPTELGPCPSARPPLHSYPHPARGSRKPPGQKEYHRPLLFLWAQHVPHSVPQS